MLLSVQWNYKSVTYIKYAVIMFLCVLIIVTIQNMYNKYFHVFWIITINNTHKNIIKSLLLRFWDRRLNSFQFHRSELSMEILSQKYFLLSISARCLVASNFGCSNKVKNWILLIRIQLLITSFKIQGKTFWPTDLTCPFSAICMVVFRGLQQCSRA